MSNKYIRSNINKELLYLRNNESCTLEYCKLELYYFPVKSNFRCQINSIQFNSNSKKLHIEQKIKREQSKTTCHIVSTTIHKSTTARKAKTPYFIIPKTSIVFFIVYNTLNHLCTMCHFKLYGFVINYKMCTRTRRKRKSGKMARNTVNIRMKLYLGKYMSRSRQVQDEDFH